jgi:rare lipoprotein A
MRQSSLQTPEAAGIRRVGSAGGQLLDQPPAQQKASNACAFQPGLDINRAHKDGAPWWDVDVNKIPDATPTLHTGNYKANPYTVLGKTYFPMQDSRNYRAEGTASWYGTKFHGQNTANGELYDLYGMSAAHKTCRCRPTCG